MFSIIISEKGGAERRETYDKTEINVGRVQGNDLMLPKGNVSKRHARLLYRDGRFIVTDLKSTNGTYVNGRKIAQATIVREGDKIYIGDFVLRIELTGEGQVAADGARPNDEAPEVAPDVGVSDPPRASYRPSPGPQAGPPAMATSGPPPLPGGGPQVMMQPQAPAPPQATALGPGPAPHPQAPMAPGMGLAPPQRAGATDPPTPAAHLMHAQQSGAPAPQNAAQGPFGPQAARVDGAGAPIAPPAYVGGAAPMLQPGGAPAGPEQVGRITASASSPPSAAAASALGAASAAHPSGPATANPGIAPPALVVPPAPQPNSSGGGLGSGSRSGQISAPPPASTPTSAPIASPRSSVRSAAASEGLVEPSQVAEHRGALARLMERISSTLDLSPLDSGEPPSQGFLASIDSALKERAAAMRSAGEIPQGIDSDVLVAEARRELTDLGPLGPLLDDEYVEEVQVVRHDHVVALHGKKQVATEIAFTSELAVSRVVRRICVRGRRPLAEGEVFVERRLERGARLFGILPPASGDGHLLVIRKPQRALSTLEDLVRGGTLSRAMATFLAQSVQGRANILVTGGVGSGAVTLLGALAGAGNIEDRVVVLQEDDELIFNQPHTVSIMIGDTADEGARAVHAAIRVRPDRLVIGAFAGHVVAEVVDAIGDGVDGVLAAARAPTLRHLVTRLPADLAGTKRMLALETAREWLASSFDLVIEMGRLRDGRHRAMRIAEFTLEPPAPAGVRDIFTFAVERTAAGGAVEGTFHPTGIVPRVAEDLVARGAPVDMSIFKRAGR